MSEDERKLFIEGIGFVVFRKNPRAGRLIIRVKNDGQVIVTIPNLVSYNKAILFVETKEDWILKVQKKLNLGAAERIFFNENTEFSTVNHKLHILRYSGKGFRKELKSDMLLIKVPFSEDIESHNVQTKIKQAIIDTWRSEAKEILVKRTLELAALHNFQVTDIKIKNMRTRWGSCSKKNTINLNLHMVRIPDYLRDYIILHELVHTAFKNHGEKFWKLLNEMTGNAKELSKELKSLNCSF